MSEAQETWVKVSKDTPAGTVVFHVTHLGMVKTRTRSEVWGSHSMSHTHEVLIDGHQGPVRIDVLYEQCKPENAGRGGRPVTGTCGRCSDACPEGETRCATCKY